MNDEMPTSAADERVVVMDVGATGGLHPRWRRLKGRVHAVLFDPDPRATFPQQEGISQSVVPLALSESGGPKTIHFCKKPEVSSFYKPNTPELAKWTPTGRFEILKSETLDTTTLDAARKKLNLPRIDFIKLDTQGAELGILKGGTATLDSVIGLEIEVEFLHYYVDQPRFADVDLFMRDRSFELFDLKSPFYWKRQGVERKEIEDKGRLIFADALYFRDPDWLLARNDPALLVRAIFCFAAYDYARIVQYLLEQAAKRNLLSDNEINRFLVFLASQGRA